MRNFFSFLLAAGLLIGCVATPAPAETGKPAEGVQLVRADAPRQEPSDAVDPDVAQLAAGINRFAFDLYHALPEDPNANRIFSPYSIALAFSMVYAGARGETEAQMAEVLHYLPQETQHAAFNALDQRLAGLGAGAEAEGEAFRLNIANAVWGQQGFPFQEAYLETLAQHYGAGLQAVDFSSNPDRAREMINAWVAEETEERIQDMLPEGVIDAMTRLVLANAIYFKAAWLFPFEESATQDGPFTRLDGSQASVPMMHQNTARVPYAEGEGYQAVLLPYTGETVDMLAVLPAEGQFAAIEERLSADFLDDIRQRAEVRDVTLSMSKFDFEAELDLVELLAGMGMPDAFSGAADFSGIGGGLFISDALHKGTITVDEKGTEAAAATVIAMAESAFPRAEVALDRPFLFAILERESGAVLFLGRVLEP